MAKLKTVLGALLKVVWFVIDLDVSSDGQIVTLHIGGSFDVTSYEAFNAAYRPYLDDENSVFVIDMAKTTYLDSSALGMLLMLRDRTHGLRSRVLIDNVNEEVMEILRIASFDQLFNIAQKA